MQRGARNTIADVAGLRVGNAEDAMLRSGCTVVVGARPFVAGVSVMGGGAGHARDGSAGARSSGAGGRCAGPVRRVGVRAGRLFGGGGWPARPRAGFCGGRPACADRAGVRLGRG